MAEDRFDRTERATPRRREEARQKGQVARSKEVSSVAVLLAAIGVFYFMGGDIASRMGAVVGSFFVESATFQLTAESAGAILERSLKGMFLIMLPFLLFPAVGLLSNVAQIGLLFTTEPITPKFSKLDPIEGFKRIFSPTAANEFVKSIVKMIIIGFVAYVSLRDEMMHLGSLVDTDTTTIFAYLGATSFDLLTDTAWVLVVIAILDYAFQRWEYERNLMMSKHEIKEEHKDTEGQPLVKSRIRMLQRQMARQRMMQKVPEATVVVTNPTHLAIALKYEQGKTSAPIVVAKGAGEIAKRIKAVAAEHGVPVVENKPLARAMWKAVEIGMEIPAALYQGVAEVLAYVMRLRRKR
jgi:flagellar biosynthetic protein FlhB